jgi:hypothetical protein
MTTVVASPDFAERLVRVERMEDILVNSAFGLFPSTKGQKRTKLMIDCATSSDIAAQVNALEYPTPAWEM